MAMITKDDKNDNNDKNDKDDKAADNNINKD